MAKHFEELVLESLNNLHEDMKEVKKQVSDGTVNGAVLASRFETIEENTDKLFDLVANGDNSLIRQVSEIKTRVTTIEVEQSRRRKADESNDRVKAIVDKAVDKVKDGKGSWKVYLGVAAGALGVIGGLLALTAKAFELGRILLSGR